VLIKMTSRAILKLNFLSVLSCLVLILNLVACARSARLSVEQEVLKEETLQQLLTKTVIALRENSSSGNSKAEALLKLALELSPNDVRVLDGLGCAAWRYEHYELAEHYFKQAIKIDPKYDRAYVHLSLVAEARSELEAAKELLQIALQLNPLNYRARNNYAVFLHNQPGTVTDQELSYQELLKAYYSANSLDEVLLYNKAKLLK